MRIEIEQEADGRWLAEAPEIPGCLAYGATPTEARRRCIELVFRVLAERVANSEALPPSVDRMFPAAA